MNGTLYGVGVGPGDPENLTIKAVRTMERCDILILPAKSKDDCLAYKIAASAVPGINEKEALFFHFPMTKNNPELRKAHDSIYKEIKSLLDSGHDLAFLTIGDPTVYSTYIYIHEKVINDGGSAIIINGIPSFCACAARLGIPLAGREEEIHIIPANKDISDALKLTGTRIFMKAGSHLTDLIEQLKEHSKTHPVNVYGVASCGLPDEKIYQSIDELEKVDKSYFITLIITGTH